MIGPSLPPHLRTNQPGDNQTISKEASDEEEDESYAPALPPHLMARRTRSGVATEPLKKLEEETDGSEDEIGPRPPSGSAPQHEDDDGIRDFLAREARLKALAEEEKKPKPLQREEWMLRPPTSAESLQSLDPTKIKTRQFSKATGREEVKKDVSLWTETPAERQARLADELSGKRKRQTTMTTGAEEDEGVAKRRKTNQEELKREIETFNKTARPSSLLEMHQVDRQTSQSTSERDVIWDRERDMAIGGRSMDQTSRNKLIQDAKTLGDRFRASNRGTYND
ncbi:hypothetical protein FRC14_008247 [Serendipita sp. 396]|nr:hypothetical protein FRC14_008247 [Serendipita sp. 396]KAG8786265.1 hypothetical protein FRC15_011762 [Serendipita sp. 397]KAG8824982.1 hypothetical protein FRC19_000667 [Serendipita sp. 401]KAG8855796.1 hypothetical protein FRB91_001685 [Serendipita sp. 411]KAG9056046.1 hypothetical protein FS842_000438 [Serendipita sp. 407]